MTILHNFLIISILIHESATSSQCMPNCSAVCVLNSGTGQTEGRRNSRNNLCTVEPARKNNNETNVLIHNQNVQINVDCSAACPLKLQANFPSERKDVVLRHLDFKRHESQIPKDFASAYNSSRSQNKNSYAVTLKVTKPAAGRIDCFSTEDPDSYKRINFFPIFEEPAVVDSLCPKRVHVSDRMALIPCLVNHPTLRPRLKWKACIEDNFEDMPYINESFRYHPQKGYRFRQSFPLEWTKRFYQCDIGAKRVEIYPKESRRKNVTLTFNRKEKAFLCRYHGVETNLAGFCIHKTCDSLDDCELVEDPTDELHQIFKEPFPTRPLFINRGTERGKVLCGYYDELGFPIVSASLIYFTGLDGVTYILPTEIPTNAVLRLTVPAIKFLETPLEVKCEASTFLLGHTLYLYVRSNDSVQPLKDTNRSNWHSSYMRKTHVVFTPNMTEIVCLAPRIRTLEWVSSNETLSGFERNPKLMMSSPVRILNDESRDQYLLCQAIGHPEPQVGWEIPPHVPLHMLSYEGGQNSGKATIRIPYVNESIAGNYTCTARNKNGIDTFVQRVQVRNQNEEAENVRGPNLVLSFVSAGVLLIVFVLLVRMLGQKIRRRKLTKQAISSFLDCEHEAEWLTYEQLIILPDIILGGGEFGIVYEGKLRRDIPVAVKTIRSGSSSEKLQILLDEIKTMLLIGDHQHVIKFYGAVIENIRKEEVFMALELCKGGSLRDYLLKAKPFFKDELRETSFSMTDHSYHNDCSHVSTCNLFTWCVQIACGMQYLASKRIIHRDLAARNVLIFDGQIAKISDLGLATQLPQGKDSIVDRKISFSWKWTAIEALLSKKFTLKSDVWSFGVTAWEIFTLGADPYHDMRFSASFILKLQRGELRLPKPGYGNSETHAKLLECWDVLESERPSFAALQMFFAEQRQKMETGPIDGRCLSMGSDYVFQDDCDDGYFSPVGDSDWVHLSKLGSHPKHLLRTTVIQCTVAIVPSDKVTSYQSTVQKMHLLKKRRFPKHRLEIFF